MIIATKTAEQRLLAGLEALWEAVMGIDYKEPGIGAIEFARTFTVGQSFSSAMPTVQQLMGGLLHDPADKKVKRCAYCAYYFRDRTKNNSGVVCSPKCRNLRKAAYTRSMNAAKPKKPKKLTARQRFYQDWHEYPFWTGNDYEMLKQSWKTNVPYSTDKVERIKAAKDLKESMNGRKKPSAIVEYNGDEKGTNHRVSVKFPVSDKSEWPVTVTKMSAEVFNERYTPEILSAERRRSWIFEKEPWGKSQYMR